MSKISPASGSISVIIRSYKSAVKRQAGIEGYQDFHWQKRFYDHIIRNKRELIRIRKYILNNTVKWSD